MNEKPMEWMTVCGEGTAHKIGRIASLAVAIICFFLMILSGQTLIMVGTLVFAGLFAWMQTHSFVEYEFCYFADEVDVAVIYNRARRKRKMRFGLEEVEYMVKRLESLDVMKYFCPKGVEGIYTLVLNQDGKRTGLVMEADPEFVKVMEMKRKVR